MEGQRGVVLRRAVSWPLRAEGVSPGLRPLPDHRGVPVVEVEPDPGRLSDGTIHRDGDGEGNEEAMVGVSHEEEEEERCRGRKAS